MCEAGVSFENIVWSVYHDMGWRTHFFLHMAANYRLKALPHARFGWNIGKLRTKSSFNLRNEFYISIINYMGSR